MTGSEVDTAAGAQAEHVDDEVRRLRSELQSCRAVSARALARATRLARLVSALGQRTDVADILDRAACEVAEQYAADIAVVLVPSGDGEGMQPAAHWGISAKHLPDGTCARPADVRHLTSALPVLAGPVAEFDPPPWLLHSRPRHIAWGLLTVRTEDLGYLLLARRADEPFERADVQELGAVVGRIALAVDNGRLYRHAQEQLHRLRRLHEVTAALAGIVDLDRAVHRIAETLVAEVPVTGAAVYLAHQRGFRLAALAGAVRHAPRHIAARQASHPPDSMLLYLGADGSRLGALLLTDAPPAGSEARSFLDHLADIAGLALEKALLFEKIRTQAQTDALTGLPNRSLFMDRLCGAVARCEQTGSDLAVIFVDLDGFKAVNDTYGHDAGDQLLVQVARRLRRAVRASDTVARLGGDEFVVLSEDMTTEDTHNLVAERIQYAIDKPHRIEGASGAVEVCGGGSIGVGTARGAEYDASALLRNADSAMYAAKQHRRHGM